MVNWKNRTKSIVMKDTHTFTHQSTDRGWHDFIMQAKLLDPDAGYINESDGLVYFRAQLQQSQSYEHSVPGPCDFIGLQNCGAVCYANAVIQSLFHIKKFRQIIFNATAGRDDEELKLVRAFQKVFAQLQRGQSSGSNSNSNHSVKNDIISVYLKSMNLEENHMMNQEDCQEFVNFLFDLIEKELKGCQNGGNDQDGSGEANG